VSPGFADDIHDLKQKIFLDLKKVREIAAKHIGKDLHIEGGRPKAEEPHTNRAWVYKSMRRQERTEAL